MDSDTKLIGNMALLPIRSQFKGPAPRESKFRTVSENLPVHRSSHGLLQASPSESDEGSHGLEMECFAVYGGGKKFSNTYVVQITEKNYAEINMHCAPSTSVVSEMKAYSYYSCASSRV